MRDFFTLATTVPAELRTEGSDRQRLVEYLREEGRVENISRRLDRAASRDRRLG